jgi:2,3-dihydroxybenzoate decarboxylase
MRTIGLEEHFVTPELVAYGASTSTVATPQAWADASRRLLDLFDERIDLMDATGLDVQVLSLNSPGLQAEKDADVAVDSARTVNDFLACFVQRRPDRFAGFAALPLQDPQRAAAELERAVVQLGFHGALVNAHTNGMYLDHPSQRVVWEKAAELDVPIYLHPANGVDLADTFSGHPELVGPMWSWGLDTATHTLRLIFGKVFDDIPEAKLLLGHMGEGLPYALWRLDSRWDFHNHHGIELDLGYPSEYLRRNLYITTSGVCDAAPLSSALMALGREHILLGTDYPFEEMAATTDFIRGVDIDEDTRHAIAHGNAERLLRLPVPGE